MNSWPLTGRREEVERIAAILHGKERSGVVLAGPAGVGKTRLASQCLALAAERGYATVRILASQSAATLPLGVFAPLISDASGAERSPTDVLIWARREIVRLGAGHPLALLVDDVHFLDDTSAALIAQVIVAGDAFVIATLRSDEPSPDAVVGLWKDELVERIEVRALDEDTMAALLTSALGGPVDEGTSRRFTEASAGNVLYLRELVLAALDAGVLEEDGGIWRLAGDLPISSRLVELVQARLGPLTGAERGVLEMLAHGEPLGVAALEAGHGRGVVAGLEGQGLLTVIAEGRRLNARLAHPVYGDVLRAQAPALRARTVKRALADAIAPTGTRRREDGLRYATWSLEGGGRVEAGVMLQAAVKARQLWDLALAERLARAAAGGGAGFAAQLLLGQLAALQGRPTEAEDLFSSLASEAKDDGQRAELACSQMQNLLIGLGRSDDAIAVAEAAEAAVQDPHMLDQIRCRRADTLFVSGRSRDCLEVLRPVLGRAEPATLVEACATASLCLNMAGRFSEALELTSRGLDAHVALGEGPTSHPRYVHLLARGVALCNSGRLREAEELAKSEHRAAISAGATEVQANFAQLACWAMFLQGRIASAGRYTSEAARLFRSMGWMAYLRFSLAHLAHSKALGGDQEGARAALAELDALGIADTDVSGALIVESRAWVEVLSGDHAKGRKLLWEAAGLAAGQGDRILEASALHSLARIGDTTACDRLAPVVAGIEGELAPARLVHSRALADGDVERLLEASVAFEQMGALLYAAEAAAAAAVCLRRTGQAHRTTGPERRAAGLARRCQGAMTPALVRIETQALLTARELEVAGLAAAGLSNREIADRLYVSVRTIETQLQRVYEKLGVHGRKELPAALVQ